MQILGRGIFFTIIAKQKIFSLRSQYHQPSFADASANFMNQRSTRMADKQYIERDTCRDVLMRFLNSPCIQCGDYSSIMSVETCIKLFDSVPAADVKEGLQLYKMPQLPLEGITETFPLVATEKDRRLMALVGNGLHRRWTAKGRRLHHEHVQRLHLLPIRT